MDKPSAKLLGLGLRHRILAHALCFALAFTFTSGCSKPKDVTNDLGFGNFNSVLGIWKTKVPLRLVETEKTTYLIYGEQYTHGIELALLPVGTGIRVEHLIYRDSFETSYLDVTGSIVNGKYFEKSVHIDDRLFMPAVLPSGTNKGTMTQYYSVWNGHDYPKPDWAAAPDKLERVTPE